jgi:hypothetical protein
MYKTVELDTAYQCGHALHLVKTVTNEDEEECCLGWGYEQKLKLCPECRKENASRYREVYNTIENPLYDRYTILFTRSSPSCNGSMIIEERLENSNNGLRSTLFLVENDIDHWKFTPVGIYRGNHFLPFSGYTDDYMQFLLQHNGEVAQAEHELRAHNQKKFFEWVYWNGD